jgi:hypothetical protein
MSDRAGDRWAIARLLFATHLPFLALCWAGFAAAVVALTFALALRVDLDQSVWDPAVSVARWFALGYGVYFVNRLLPVYVAHGRTRREFATNVAVFLVAASAMVAALLALGLALEGVLYRALGWPHQVDAERLYDAAGPYPLVFISYWALMLTWAAMGLLLGAGFNRSSGSALVAIALALAMLVVTGYAIGFDGLPFLGSVVDLARVSLAGTLALCLAGLLPGVAVTWALVRDIPIRNRVT